MLQHVYSRRQSTLGLKHGVYFSESIAQVTHFLGKDVRIIPADIPCAVPQHLRRSAWQSVDMFARRGFLSLEELDGCDFNEELSAVDGGFEEVDEDGGEVRATRAAEAPYSGRFNVTCIRIASLWGKKKHEKKKQSKTDSSEQTTEETKPSRISKGEHTATSRTDAWRLLYTFKISDRCEADTAVVKTTAIR
eukprot:1190788-Prorocentrum_minimum.AAC.2